MSVIVCSVLPKPISSARMQPFPPWLRMPITHSYMNWKSGQSVEISPSSNDAAHLDTFLLVRTKELGKVGVHDHVDDCELPV